MGGRGGLGCAVEPESDVGSRGQCAPFPPGRPHLPGESPEETAIAAAVSGCPTEQTCRLRLLRAPGLETFKKCAQVRSLRLCPALGSHCTPLHLPQLTAVGVLEKAELTRQTRCAFWKSNRVAKSKLTGKFGVVLVIDKFVVKILNGAFAYVLRGCSSLIVG